MSAASNPFRDTQNSVLSERDFVEWLEGIDPTDPASANKLAHDMDQFGRELRYNEAAALLRATNQVEPPPGFMPDVPSTVFLVGGAYPAAEAMLAYAIMASLGQRIALHVLPALKSTRTIARQLESICEFCKDPIQDAELDPSGLPAWIHRYDVSSVRNRLVEAIGQYLSRDHRWHALLLLLCAPACSERHFVCIDVKVGKPSEGAEILSYLDAMDLARDLMKIATVAEISCHVIVSEASTTTPLAFGALAEVEDLRRALFSGRATPPMEAAVAAAAGAYAMSSASPADAEKICREALSSGDAGKAALSWPLLCLSRQPAIPVRTCHSPSSGYLSRVDLETAFSSVGMGQLKQTSATQNERSALILPRVGDHIEVGTDLIKIYGSDDAEASLCDDLIQACGLERELRYHPTIRSRFLIESILVRRYAVAVVPLVLGAESDVRLFVLKEGDGRSLELITNLLSQDQGTQPTTPIEVAQRLAEIVIPKEVATDLVRGGRVIDRHPRYDAEADIFLSLHYDIYFAVALDSGGSGGQMLQMPGAQGDWLTMDELRGHQERFGPVLRLCWGAIQMYGRP